MIKLPCYHDLALCDKKTLSCLLTNPISMSVYRGYSGNWGDEAHQMQQKKIRGSSSGK